MKIKHNSINRQKGAAIIVAIFVMSIVAIAAVAMIDRLNIDIRRTKLILNDTKANFLAKGSIAWAMATLNDNLTKLQANKVIEVTPIKSPIDKKHGATIETIIYDAEGRFNLNNLQNPDWEEPFIRLIRAVEPSIDYEGAKNIATGVKDWISPAGANIGLEEYYLKQSPAYKAPRRPMASISELRLIKDIDQKIYNKLLPHVIALPEETKINVNSASYEVLMSLSPTFNKAACENIISIRQQSPFGSPESFLQLDIVKNHQISDKLISNISSYFLVKSEIKIEKQHTTIYTMLHRLLNNAKPIETIIWQSKGTL